MYSINILNVKYIYINEIIKYIRLFFTNLLRCDFISCYKDFNEFCFKYVKNLGQVRGNWPFTLLNSYNLCFVLG